MTLLKLFGEMQLLKAKPKLLIEDTFYLASLLGQDEGPLRQWYRVSVERCLVLPGSSGHLFTLSIILIERSNKDN